MDTDEATPSSFQLDFGTETLQDEEMQSLGIGINSGHNLVICTICHSAIVPEKLYSHIRIPGHHEKKDFKKGQRLAFVTKEFCQQFISNHDLGDPNSKQPKSIIPAIPGLEIRTGMMICSCCGYAVQTKKALCRHQALNCPQGRILKGPAQTFLISLHSRYFGVKLPPRSNFNPQDSTALFYKQFASDPYTDIPIQATIHPREMNIFLTRENWLDEVDGMTGHQITKLARGALPNLRARARKSVSHYILKRVNELKGGEHPTQIAMGDYNK